LTQLALRRVVEDGFGKADLQVIDQFIHDDWIGHQTSLKGGKVVLKKAILSLDSAFSNRHYALAIIPYREMSSGFITG
jgi:hypothetical protein